MPWLNWSDAIKKRICRYLLQRYLGQFLQEKLTLDQLSVDLYNGKGRISDVCLDVKGLNELGEKFNLPIRFVEGFIASIEVAIPWTKPLTDNSVVEIDGLMMTVQPKQRVDDASMFEPMWGSMMSSMQLAEEYLRQEPLDKELDARAAAEPLAGLEQFAQAIETVFSRIKVKLTNTVIRVEHFPSPSSQQGVALELHIKSMDYYDQVSTEAGDIAGETIAQRVHERISLSTKRIILNGSSLYAEEFSVAKESSSGLLPRSTAGNDELLAGCAGASPPLVAPSQQSSAPQPEPEPILISQLMGQQEIRLQLKQDESLEGPNVDVDFSLGQLPLFLCPRQVHLLIQLAKGFSCPTPASEDLSGSLLSRRYKCKPMDSHHFAIAEEDLQRQMINLRGAPLPPSRSLGGPHATGWSTCSAGESTSAPLLGREALLRGGETMVGSLAVGMTTMQYEQSTICSNIVTWRRNKRDEPWFELS